MCGIAGIATWSGPAPTASDIAAMCDAMSHRGPDDAGYLVEDGVALGMRRLSIIDLATGHQPIFNEDDSACIFFNGEIYDYAGLRRELEQAGHRFHTQSDTEVVLHAWEQWGVDFAKRLNGMFAVAILDRKKRQLILARDHLGIKPFYYSLVPGGMVFGSEIKVLLASGRVSREMDLDAVAQLLSWEYVPGEATPFRSIRRLPPASTLTVDLATGRLETSVYWDVLDDSLPEAAKSQATFEELCSQTDDVIRAAVQRQMISDVPLGAFLSGGVDSSLVAAHMGRALTFSIGFDDPTYDESRWSSRVAESLGVQHEVQVVRPQVRELFDKLMHFMDDPIGDFSIFPTYLVSDVARRKVKVALSGDGGDELFGGYESYVAQERARLWQRIPGVLRNRILSPAILSLRPSAAKKGLTNKMRRFVEGAALDERLGHARWRLFAAQGVREHLFAPQARAQLTSSVGAHIEALAERSRNLEARDRALYVDLRSYLVDNCLAKVDRMSMACSLEVRVPLLDMQVVRHGLRLPARYKMAGGSTKILLKSVAARHVPRECIYRSKQGFSIPMKHWLNHEFADLVGHYLDPARLARSGIFNPQFVGRLRSEHQSGRENHSHLLWTLLVFEQWRDRWAAI
jgi:asparagine synthase (glutamine-hydrolysing)